MFSLRAFSGAAGGLLARRSMSHTAHSGLNAWIDEMAQLVGPTDIHVMDGSDAERDQIFDEMTKAGKVSPLDQTLHPGSYYAHSDPSDVARVEDRTFICSEAEADAGPTNNWADPKTMMETLKGKFANAYNGRRMYVIPFSMGPLGSPISQLGVEISDSPYVAASMAVMNRVGKAPLEVLGTDGSFIKAMHSVGQPLAAGEKDVAWPCNKEKYITHFPENREIWSFGSGYGGNSLLSKKCAALRIGSVMGRDDGWMAEHMLIMSIVSPKGKRTNIAAAFPSACGKTNLAMLRSSLPGWDVTCIGDDIAWMKIGDDGQLRAINPEFGMFGVAPGTNVESNPNAMTTVSKNTVFTNVALTPDGKDVWWEDMTKEKPKNLTDWRGQPWTPESATPAAQPNSRFCAPLSQCPSLDAAWEDPAGLPIDAIIFGGRRRTTVPLVFGARSWAHGTFVGASVSSEMTAAQAGTMGKLRHDPFAMLPFCGYNMGDYFGHWLEMGKQGGDKMPHIFHVNWFRQDAEGKFMWPGFGENLRVLEWIANRVQGEDNAVDTPIGWVPKHGAINTAGLDISDDTMDKLLHVDTTAYKAEVDELQEYFGKFGDRLPAGIAAELDGLRERLG